MQAYIAIFASPYDITPKMKYKAWIQLHMQNEIRSFLSIFSLSAAEIVF